MSTRPGGAYSAYSSSGENDGGNRRSSTKPLDAPEMLVGRMLDGRFRLERVLNAGGMGIIFEATQLSVGRTVAIKVLKPSLSGDYDLKKRFLREVELVASLSHPNIVSLIDAGTDGGGLSFLVMEFVAGSTFREALRASRLTLCEIVEIFRQSCEALIEAHGHGVIHRDLKFDNIMISHLRDRRLHVQVLDFGVAKVLGADEGLTRNGQIPGTPGIIAPELVDEKPPTPRSDLYSLGVLMFTALAGRTPFQGQNELELMRAHKLDDVPNLREYVRPSVPEALIELTYELLSKEPERRPDSADAVRDRLERIVERLSEERKDREIYRPLGDGEESAFRGDIDASMEQLEQVRSGTVETRSRRDSREDAPIVAPASIVAMLIIILIVVILVLIYVLYTTFVLPPVGVGP